MIGTSTYEYVFIRACILGLHYIAPLSILYCLVFTFLNYRISWPVELWAFAEAAFYILVHIVYRKRLQQPATYPTPLTREERRILFARCNATINDPEQYLRGWFLGAPLDEIKRDNLKEFFLWAFFDRDGLPGDDDPELEEYVISTQKLLDRNFEAGRGRAVCLRLTLDEVRMLHRSLLWYFCVGFVDFLTCLNLYRHGFRLYGPQLIRFFRLFPLRPFTLFTRHRSPVKQLTYWLRPHTAKDKFPVVFIHGIGIGLYPYVNFLAELNANSNKSDDQIGIIAIEIMPVSFRITHPALEKEEMCRQIKAVLDHHGVERFVLVSHSYGSAISTHLLHSPDFANRIGPLVLIDPVTILLHQPDVAFNFTRRQPVRANEHQLYYFASMDLGVSHALSRGFFWSQNILWKEDIADHEVTVSLSGVDLIVNTHAVRRYLTTTEHDTSGSESQLAPKDSSGKKSNHMKRFSNGKLQVLWHDDLDHAQVFDRKKTRDAVNKIIREYCAVAGDSST